MHRKLPPVERLGREEDVFEDRESWKEFRDLKGPGDAQRRTLIRGSRVTSVPNSTILPDVGTRSPLID